MPRWQVWKGLWFSVHQHLRSLTWGQGLGLPLRYSGLSILRWTEAEGESRKQLSERGSQNGCFPSCFDSLWGQVHCSQGLQGLQACWAPLERKRNEILRSAGMGEQEIIQTSKQDSQIIFFPIGSIWSNFWFVPKNSLSKASLQERVDTAQSYRIRILHLSIVNSVGQQNTKVKCAGYNEF